MSHPTPHWQLSALNAIDVTHDIATDYQRSQPLNVFEIPRRYGMGGLAVRTDFAEVENRQDFKFFI